MRLIHDQECIVSVRDRDKVFERCEIAIHAIETFDHDPGAAYSALGPPVANYVFDRARIVMDAYLKLGATGTRAFMNTCVHQRIQDKQIAPLGQRCQVSKIWDITDAKEDCRSCSKKTDSFCLETFVLLAIAAQKADPPAPIGVPASTAARFIRAREREIIVRGEIDARARLEAAQPVVFFQGMQGRDVGIKLHEVDWIHRSLRGKPNSHEPILMIATGGLGMQLSARQDAIASVNQPERFCFRPVK